jgi:chromosome segregation ATPase
MRKLAMTPDALPHRGTAAPFRVGLGLAASVMMLWGVGTYGVSFASEPGYKAVPETSITLDDRVAALSAELAQVKAETANLREGQSDTSVELSRIRAGLANAEIGLESLRSTVDENAARQVDTAGQIASKLDQLKDETLHLRSAQDEAATDMGSLRAHVANSEIGIGSLRADTGELRQQFQRIEAARDVTSSIARSHKHHVHKKWMAQR